MSRVAVTRPQSDGERTAAALRALGHDVLLAPLMEIQTVKADVSGAWSGVIVTSANALRGPQLDALKSLPLFAVGARTAEAAREIGFQHVVSAGGDACDLVGLIAEHGVRDKPLLYLAGEHRAADLPVKLAAYDIAIETAVVYRARALPFPGALADALKQKRIDAVLHFSRRSAELYLAGAKTAGVLEPALSARHCCLSQQVAVPLADAGAPRVAVAPQPDEAALLGLLGAT